MKKFFAATVWITLVAAVQVPYAIEGYTINIVAAALNFPLAAFCWAVFIRERRKCR